MSYTYLIRQALDYRSNPSTINGSQTTYTTCTYDANGERLMRYNQTHYYYYYYDGVNLLFVKKDNAIDMRYLYDNEGNVYCAIANDGLPYWHHTDIRGSVTNVLKGDSGTSSSPTLIRSYLYNAYGDTNYTTFSGGETFNANPYLAYTGAILDQETGLYYLMSRYYDPKAGSFISQDSYKGEGDAFWHLYAYCDGDPVNKTDRNGHYAWALYSSSDTCAHAFAKLQLPNTRRDFKERGAVIYKYSVKFNNTNRYVDRYIYTKVDVGGHSNVVWSFIKQRYLIAAPKFTSSFKKRNRIKDIKYKARYAFVHTHPYCNGHDGNNFSPQDKSLVTRYGMTACYVGTPEGKLLKYAKLNNGKAIYMTTLYRNLPKATLRLKCK